MCDGLYAYDKSQDWLGHSDMGTTVNINNPHNEKAKQPKYYKQSLLTKMSISSVG